jgi:subtilisin-like proprotein convertase family protein
MSRAPQLFVLALCAASLVACGSSSGKKRPDGGGDDDIDAGDQPDGSTLDADLTPDAALPDAEPADAGADLVERCANGADDDQDTLIDCDDPDCTASLACSVSFTCPTGQTRVIVDATGLPLLINGGETTISTLAVTDTGTVTSAAVQVTLVHPYVGDMHLVLVAPAGGGSVSLSSGNGSSGDGYDHTLFVDSATQAIVDADAPFTGAFTPEQPLSGIMGVGAQGDWVLQAIETAFDDDPQFDVGALSEVSIGLCLCDGCELGLQCLDNQDNDGDTMTDCADPDCSGVPFCQLGGCAAGETLVRLTTAVPAAIPDESEISRVISAPTAGTIKKVMVQFSAEHEYMGDLFIKLAPPGVAAAMAVTALMDIGDSADEGFLDTFLADDATTTLAMGSVPYTGAFKPIEAFASMIGGPAAGDWTVIFGDDAGADQGAITEFQLFVCVQE